MKTSYRDREKIRDGTITCVLTNIMFKGTKEVLVDLKFAHMDNANCKSYSVKLKLYLKKDKKNSKKIVDKIVKAFSVHHNIEYQKDGAHSLVDKIMSKLYKDLLIDSEPYTANN